MLPNINLNEVLYDYNYRRGVFRHRTYPKTSDALNAFYTRESGNYEEQKARSTKIHKPLIEAKENLFSNYFSLETDRLLIAHCLLRHPELFYYLGDIEAIGKVFDSITYQPLQMFPTTKRILNTIQSIKITPSKNLNTCYVNRDLNLMDTELNRVIIAYQRGKGFFGRFNTKFERNGKSYQHTQPEKYGSAYKELSSSELKLVKTKADAESYLQNVLHISLHYFIIAECLATYPHIFGEKTPARDTFERILATGDADTFCDMLLVIENTQFEVAKQKCEAREPTRGFILN